jgi:hypothetical protein
VEAFTDPAPGGATILCGDDPANQFIVWNGAKGEQGEQGIQGPAGSAGSAGPGDSGSSAVSGCSVADEGAYFSITCDDGTGADLAKAYCGATAYDPTDGSWCFTFGVPPETHSVQPANMGVCFVTDPLDPGFNEDLMDEITSNYSSTSTMDQWSRSYPVLYAVDEKTCLNGQLLDGSLYGICGSTIYAYATHFCHDYLGGPEVFPRCGLSTTAANYPCAVGAKGGNAAYTCNSTANASSTYAGGCRDRECRVTNGTKGSLQGWYNPNTHFCSLTDLMVYPNTQIPCDDGNADPTTQYCRDANRDKTDPNYNEIFKQVPNTGKVNLLYTCMNANNGLGPHGQEYNPETHFCWWSYRSTAQIVELGTVEVCNGTLETVDAGDASFTCTQTTCSKGKKEYEYNKNINARLFNVATQFCVIGPAQNNFSANCTASGLGRDCESDTLSNTVYGTVGQYGGQRYLGATVYNRTTHEPCLPTGLDPTDATHIAKYGNLMVEGFVTDGIVKGAGMFCKTNGFAAELDECGLNAATAVLYNWETEFCDVNVFINTPRCDVGNLGYCGVNKSAAEIKGTLINPYSAVATGGLIPTTNPGKYITSSEFCYVYRPTTSAAVTGQAATTGYCSAPVPLCGGLKLTTGQGCAIDNTATPTTSTVYAKSATTLSGSACGDEDNYPDSEEWNWFEITRQCVKCTTGSWDTDDQVCKP